MSTLIDSYDESNQTTNYTVTYGQSAHGQCFHVQGGNFSLDSCKFYLKRSSTSFDENSYAKLFALTGTFGSTALPTGSALATSDPVSGIPTTFTLITFDFTGDDRYEMQSGVDYFIVFQDVDVGSAPSYTIGRDGDTPTHDGNIAVYDEDTEEWRTGTGDLIFYVYGEEIGMSLPVGEKYPLPAFSTNV
jgi:hypothetical protein